MSNRRSIDKVNKLLFFFAAVVIALLAGHSQGADDDETTVAERIEQKKKMLYEAQLIWLKFSVQIQILKMFYEKASQFDKIFETTHDEMTNGFKKSLVGAYWKLVPQKKYLSNLDELLTKASHNLRTDVQTIMHEWIQKAFPSLFAIESNLGELKKWLDLANQQQQELKSFEHRLDKAKMSQEQPYSKLLFSPEQVNQILHELDPVLEQMKWRRQQQLDLVDQRFDYDSMYVLLAIVRATFHTVKIAYEEKERVEEKKKADENQQALVNQQKMAKDLASAVKHMKDYAENLEIMRAKMETAMRETRPDNDYINLSLGELNTIEGYDKLGFNGDDGYNVEKLVHGDMELFAQMLGKPEGYVSAVNGPEVLLKYQLMLNAAPLWKLERAVHTYISKQTLREQRKVEERQKTQQRSKNERDHLKMLDNQCRCTFPGGEQAWQRHHAERIRDGRPPR